jgi:hypothetical protein
MAKRKSGVQVELLISHKLRFGPWPLIDSDAHHFSATSAHHGAIANFFMDVSMVEAVGVELFHSL